MSKHRVIYRLVFANETDTIRASVADEIHVEFDTQYCIPGHPFRILNRGIWFRTDGMVIEDQDDGDPIVVFIYREETDDET